MNEDFQAVYVAIIDSTINIIICMIKTTINI